MPVILGMRLSVNTFYGTSIGTSSNSTILFDPPISQTKQLESWLKINKDYVETVVAEKLYEKKNQSKDLPLHSQIRKISQILSLAQMARSFWIKANLCITKPAQCYYLLTCPGCSKPSGAIYKNDFTCFYCNNEFPSPKPLLRFEVELFDGTGSLNAFIEEKEAEIVLGMPTEKVIEADLEDKKLSSTEINKTFKDRQLLFHIRTTTFEIRGKKTVRNTIISCLPSTDMASGSQTLQQKSFTSGPQQSWETDATMLESQKTTSPIPESSTTPDTHPSKSTGKRSLYSSEDQSGIVPASTVDNVNTITHSNKKLKH